MLLNGASKLLKVLFVEELPRLIGIRADLSQIKFDNLLYVVGDVENSVSLSHIVTHTLG
jgi:hypothetical protein